MILVVYLHLGCVLLLSGVAVYFFSKSAFLGEVLTPFTTGNPFVGTKLLGFRIGRGSGALKGLSSQIEEPQKKSGAPLLCSTRVFPVYSIIAVSG